MSQWLFPLIIVWYWSHINKSNFSSKYLITAGRLVLCVHLVSTVLVACPWPSLCWLCVSRSQARRSYQMPVLPCGGQGAVCGRLCSGMQEGPERHPAPGHGAAAPGGQAWGRGSAGTAGHRGKSRATLWRSSSDKVAPTVGSCGTKCFYLGLFWIVVRFFFVFVRRSCKSWSVAEKPVEMMVL